MFQLYRCAVNSGILLWTEILAARQEHWRELLSDVVVGRTALRSRPGAETASLDLRRALQLGLAAVWLLDGVLQFQPSMYTKAFTQMLAASAAGNPSVIARPITWDANLIQHHLVLLNTIFATIQLLLGLGIALRPTVRFGLAASVAWSIAVWWFGEGLGGVLKGGADPISGGPGAVIVYALIAVLLWPADPGGRSAPFVAARAVGEHVAKALWLVFWLSQVYFVLTPDNRAPQAASGIIAGMESGEPGWLTSLMRAAASLAAGQGLATSIAFAVAFALIAVGVYLPAAAAKATLLLAVVVAAVIWVFVQALGGILATGATDPNSGPLLVLLALAYWPARPRAAGAAAFTAAMVSASAPSEPELASAGETGLAR